MKWQVKAVIQKTLSLTPAGDALHYALQKRGGALRELPIELAKKVEDWHLMVRYFENIGKPLQDATFIEVGSGWYPLIPMCLYLTGAKRIVSYDIKRNMRHETAVACAHTLTDHLERLADISKQDLAVVTLRHQNLVTALDAGKDIGAAMNGQFEYRAPGDARDTGFADQSVDIVFSNSVLEHVPREIINDIMVEAHRVLVPGGYMYHGVNCGDHYAYADTTITQLNYLRFTEAQWNKYNNEFTFQNRLRAKDFLELAKSNDFDIVFQVTPNKDRNLKHLAKVSVCSEFASYSQEELCYTTVDFIAQRPA